MSMRNAIEEEKVWSTKRAERDAWLDMQIFSLCGGWAASGRYKGRDGNRSPRLQEERGR